MKWEVVIGIETHAQLSTASKIFSGASTAFGAAPNTQAAAVDIALPGVLPVANRGAVERAIRFGLAVGATINRRSVFARKNYFYPDLPKGYQISQYEIPVVQGGELVIATPRGEKTIRLTRAHLEEDAGKSLHEDFHGMSGIDLNRAGTPLLEIVTEPDLRSSEDAVAYAKALHALVQWIGICDGNMQEGSFRCDANVSVRPLGETQLGTRCEIKNLNSFRFMQAAVDFEVQRQIALIEDGGAVVQETRLFDPDRNETRSMRGKEDAQDYRYFPDPDLPPLVVDDGWIERVRATLPELPRAMQQRFVTQYALPEADALALTASRGLAAYFEDVARTVSGDTAGAKLAANWVQGELAAALNRAEIGIERVPLPAAKLAALLSADTGPDDLRQDRQGGLRRRVGGRARRRRRRDHRRPGLAPDLGRGRDRADRRRRAGGERGDGRRVPRRQGKGLQRAGGPGDEGNQGQGQPRAGERDSAAPARALSTREAIVAIATGRQAPAEDRRNLAGRCTRMSKRAAAQTARAADVFTGAEAAAPSGSEQQRGDEDADHREHDRDLGGGAEQPADPGRDADAARAAKIALREVLADRGTDERHEQQSPQPGEHPGERSERGAQQRQARGTGALCAERGSDEIHRPGEDRQRRQDAERPRRDAREVVDPGGERNAAEDERRAGKRRQHGADHANANQHEGQEPEHSVHVDTQVKSATCCPCAGARTRGRRHGALAARSSPPGLASLPRDTPSVAAHRAQPEPLANLVDDLGDQRCRFRRPQPLDRLGSHRIVHHEECVQLRERGLVSIAARACVVVQDALDHARIEQAHVADRGERRDLVVDVAELLRPPLVAQVPVGLGHRSPPGWVTRAPGYPELKEHAVEAAADSRVPTRSGALTVPKQARRAVKLAR